MAVKESDDMGMVELFEDGNLRGEVLLELPAEFGHGNRFDCHIGA